MLCATCSVAIKSKRQLKKSTRPFEIIDEIQQEKKLQVTKLSGSTVPLDFIGIMTVGGVRVAAAQACKMFPGRARLISSVGIVARDDAAPMETLGDVATIVLSDDSWDLSSFTCGFGSNIHHPVPEVLDFLSNTFPTKEVFRAVAVPHTEMS